MARRLQRGHAKLTSAWRTTSNFIEDFIDPSTGVTSIPLVGTVANRLYDNTRNPGYPVININPAVRQTIFFGDRGQHSFKGYGMVDLAATYAVPVWKSVAPWLKVELYNALNNRKQIAWDRTVSVDPSSPLDANGIRTGYIEGPRYGLPTSDNQYPQPYPGQNGGRAIRVAFGARF